MSDERGFLTKTDREFLTGEKEYTGENAKQQRYERREAIAARTRQAFHDFALLYDTLDEHERDRIFDLGVSQEGGRVVVDREAVGRFRDSLIGTVAFLYLSLEGSLESEPSHRSMMANFEQILEAGVQKAEAERRPGDPLSYLIDPEFNVHVSKGGQQLPERAIKKIAEYRGYELSASELQALIASMDPDSTGPHAEGWGKLTELVKQERADTDE